jgi:hypothetical protein
MNALKKLASVGLVVLAASAAAITPASAATSTTRWVDDDGHAGPSGCSGSATAAKNIQKAVDNSNQDDVVIVCPGTYVGQVLIKGNRDGLTLKSSTPFGATIKTPSSLDSVGHGATYLVLVYKVDDVTVRGFKTIVRTQAPCDDVDGTIVVLGSRRAAIRGNRLLAPGAATGDCEQAEGVVVTDTVDQDPDIARSTSAVVGYNEVRDATFVGIGGYGGLRKVSVDLVHNSVRAYFAGPTSTSHISALPGGGLYGIALFGRFEGTVRYNVIQGSTSGPINGPAFYYGVYADSSGPGSPAYETNGPLDIHHNIIRRVGTGLGLRLVDEVTIRSNQISNTYFGIEMNETGLNSIRNNTIGAKGAGILVGSETGENTFRGNTVTGVGGICEDDSSGGGSHGTANTWTGNTASVGDNPNGICPLPDPG